VDRPPAFIPNVTIVILKTRKRLICVHGKNKTRTVMLIRLPDSDTANFRKLSNGILSRSQKHQRSSCEVKKIDFTVMDSYVLTPLFMCALCAFHEKECQAGRRGDLFGFPACLAFIRTLCVDCRCPVHVSVRVRRCYLELEFSLGSIGGASDSAHRTQSPDTTWENGLKVLCLFYKLRCF